MEHICKSKRNIAWASALAVLLLAGAAAPALAAEEYEVIYRGPDAPMVEEEADFFAHMDAFAAAHSQKGAFKFTNETNGPVTLHFGFESSRDESQGALVAAIKLEIADAAGNVIYSGPLAAEGTATEAYELAEVGPGESVEYLFTVTSPADAEKHAGEKGAVEWSFTVVDDSGNETSTGGAKKPGWLPKTGDPLYLGIGAVAAVATVAGITLIVSAKRKRDQEDK